MLFTHETNSDQFDLFSYGNMRIEANNQDSSCTEMNLRGTNTNSRVTSTGKENIYERSEESSFGNSLKDDSSVSPGNFSFSWLSGGDFQPTMLDHDKRPLSNTNPCQTACKRPKQTDNNNCSYSFEEHPLSSAVIPSSALVDEFVETSQPDNMPAKNGTRTCNDCSEIPCSNQPQSSGLESLHLPDWVTSFPGYFEDCGIVAGHATVDHIDSPVHEYLPRKDVPIGPEHQADIPEWRPRVSKIVPSASSSCADMSYGSISNSQFAPRDDDSENEKWVRHCVVPISTSRFDGIGGNNVDCECSDEGSVRCVRKHIFEARESLKMSLGPDKFRDLGLCEMGEDVAQEWTDEEENRFQREVFVNRVSLGKNFWDYLPHAFPGKSSKELVSYYFNVFMLRKRAQQNRSDLLRVDSDDDELPDEPPVNHHGEEDSAVESPSHDHFIKNSMSIEDVHEESEGEHISGVSLHANAVSAGDCGCSSNQMSQKLYTENIVEDVYYKDELCRSLESQHYGPINVQCAEFQRGTAE